MPKFYVTFGQQYRSRAEHPTFSKAHPDGYVTINAPSYDQAREYAFRRLGSAWSLIYDEEPESFYFPMGQIEEWDYEKPE